MTLRTNKCPSSRTNLKIALLLQFWIVIIVESIINRTNVRKALENI
nr:MAG TPA: hypothetical protein [Caudoviricetes sp.]